MKTCEIIGFKPIKTEKFDGFLAFYIEEDIIEGGEGYAVGKDFVSSSHLKKNGVEMRIGAKCNVYAIPQTDGSYKKGITFKN